jgi:hypothetical protein
VLVQDKFSFGPKPTTGRAYQIETAVIDHDAKTVKTSRVVWLGEVEISATGLLAGSEDPDARSERDEAGEFLDEMLAEGDVDADAVLAQAKKNGIAERTLRRAKRQRGVRSAKFGGHWVWTAGKAATSREDCHSPEAGSLGNLHTDKGIPGGHLEEGGSLDFNESDARRSAGVPGWKPPDVGRLADAAAPLDDYNAKLREADRYVDDWGNPVEPWDEPDP